MQRLRLRSFALALTPVAYAAIAAVQRTAGSPLAFAMLVALPIALLLGWSFTAPPLRGIDRTDDLARSGARVAFTGAALLLAARSGAGGPGFVALENVGAALASAGGLVAFARLSGEGGVLLPPRASRRLDAAAFGSPLWAAAIALPVAAVAAPERAAGLDPRWLDYATVAASLASLGIMLATSRIALSRRRLELGAAERAGAAFWLALTGMLAAVLASIAQIAPAERLLPVATAAAGVALAVSAVAREADALARVNRAALALAAMVTPIALFASYLARVSSKRSAVGVAVACVAAAVAGVLAPRIGRRLLAPAAGRWLGALDAATRAAMTPDPEAALEAALLALRGAAGQQGKDPALYFLGVPEVVLVDRAGYARRERGEPPPRLVDLATDEPEGVLRIEVLEAAAVRRPDVRPIEAWLEQRGTSAMAIVRDELGPAGLLAIPRGARRRPWTLEEILALRALCDRLGAVIGASAQLARSRAREANLGVELGRARTDKDDLERDARREASRRRAVAEAYARPTVVAAYSPAARFARQQIIAAAEESRPVTLLSAPGLDAIPWTAAAHLASPRADGPIAIVDAANASPGELDLATWRDPGASPVVAARAGTLVVLEAQALPMEIQTYIATALPDDTGLVVSLRATADALVAGGTLSEHLADKLGDRAIPLPPLATRPEDLRSLATEELARIARSLQKPVVGLDPEALAALLEHDFPGNDAELRALLLRAALGAQREVVTRVDLERAGFAAGRARPRRAGGDG